MPYVTANTILWKLTKAQHMKLLTDIGNGISPDLDKYGRRIGFVEQRGDLIALNDPNYSRRFERNINSGTSK